ncbi:MAG: hypothetical protein Q7T62_03330 [Undibacterium sp.]|nr:hypothetical protein [Undibacterium sp.]
MSTTFKLNVKSIKKMRPLTDGFLAWLDVTDVVHSGENEQWRHDATIRSKVAPNLIPNLIPNVALWHWPAMLAAMLLNVLND